MSVVLVRAALEAALDAVSPALPTVWENTPYSPDPTVPYQQAFLLLADPENTETGPAYVERGTFQVTLGYPLQGGTGPAGARADLIRAAFPRGRSLAHGGLTTVIIQTPAIARGMVDGDRWKVPVSIRFRTQVSA